MALSLCLRPVAKPPPAGLRAAWPEKSLDTRACALDRAAPKGYDVLGHGGAGVSDLGLDLVRTVGRAHRPVEAEVVRDITEADVALLATERGIASKPLQRLRDAHHAIARLVAMGRPGHEIATVTGYSQSRISILKSDPAFQDLVAHYRAQVEEVDLELYSNGAAKLAAVRDDAVEELHSRLLDEPESFKAGDLLEIVKITADRSGLGPATKSTNVNLNVDLAAQIAAARQREERLRATLVLPVVSPVAPESAAAELDSGAEK